MKKSFASLCLLVGLSCLIPISGCSDPPAVTHQNRITQPQEHTQISATFESVIENNLFHDITAFEDRLLKSETLSKNEGNRTVIHQVQMLDIYGTTLAAYDCETDDAYHVTTLTATDDGGFLFVLGFQDRAYSQNEWASDQGFASRIIKCDRDGNQQFDTALDGITGSALEHCFEKDGLFYFFGDLETPETKIRGVGSGTDIHMVTLDQNGTLKNTKCIAGSDFDNLEAAEVSGESFLLSVRSQSNDGDFAGSNSKGYPINWVITVDNQLEIIEMKRESGRDYFDFRIGERDGAPVYKSDELFKNYDAGTPEAFIHYGDFYLIVSERVTGEYEKTPPFISSIWSYTETVYSAYDFNGELLFRKAVDSSPDFDAMAEQIMNGVVTDP